MASRVAGRDFSMLAAEGRSLELTLPTLPVRFDSSITPQKNFNFYKIFQLAVEERSLMRSVNSQPNQKTIKTAGGDLTSSTITSNA